MAGAEAGFDAFFGAGEVVEIGRGARGGGRGGNGAVSGHFPGGV